ncbi:MAG: ketoacyl-ACP synthase III [Flavobacteriales bacterium]|jgi:3-oxoacyl-[acyl-carrier-protein] synthase-3|nr:ketoacyl-ACP synthase III [Flavobacteriales bacterium]MBT7656585.1 ketoacyl-ACP synthase III [Flavobacteriales bacterium]
MTSVPEKTIKAAITAVGGYVPDDILTNFDLERMVDTSDEWIRSRTGIKERRILKDPNKATSFLAIEAANEVLRKSNCAPEEIDMLILATITPDMKVAATAAKVATNIGAVNAFAFDLQAACSGFLYSLSMAAAKIEAGHCQKILVVGADKMSSIVDYTDRTTCIIFGDGAGAVLMEASSNAFGWEDEYFRSNGMGQEFLHVKAGGSLHPTTEETLAKGWEAIYQEGKTVFKNAVSEMAFATQEVLRRNDLQPETVDYIIAHQANKRILDATQTRTKLSQEQFLTNIERYGNTTAATLPLLLRDYEDQFKTGDKLLFTAFGGGFTWGSAFYTWAYN